MHKYFRMLSYFLLLSIGLSACQLPGREASTPSPETEALYTAAAQTVIADQTQASVQETPADTSTSLPSSTESAMETKPADPSTSTVTQSPTTTTTQVQPATTQADTSVAPAATEQAPSYPTAPPSTPQYAFDVQGVNIHTCNGRPRANFQIKNIGNIALESMDLKIENITVEQVVMTSGTVNTPYMTSDRKCVANRERLNPGEIGYLGGSLKDTQSGQFVRTTIFLCTKDDLAGQCYQEIVDFVMP